MNSLSRVKSPRFKPWCLLNVIFLTGLFVRVSAFMIPTRLSVRAPHSRSFQKLMSADYSISEDGLKKILKVDVGDRPLIFETGEMGKQAQGSVIVRDGDTVVYATACAEKNPEEIDFLPLKVDYFERFSAAGLTSGARNRRDGRPSDHEILISRLIDRPLRPMVQDGWTQDTQLLAWCLSYDGLHGPEVAAMCASAAALALSHVPLIRPVAGVQVGMVDGKFKVNPTKKEMEDSPLSLQLAGTAEGILMIEGSCDFLTEEQMVEAVRVGQEGVSAICKAVEAWSKVVGKPKQTDTIIQVPEQLKQALNEKFRSQAMEALRIKEKEDQSEAMSQLNKNAIAELALDEDSSVGILEVPEEGVEGRWHKVQVQRALKKMMSASLRQLVLEEGRRCDGRSTTEVRPISIGMEYLPCTHGSALFTRGETQALATATLGGARMAQKLENLDGEGDKRFYLQYSFPPSCVGEVGRTGGIGRREIGHGNLAERALDPIIPKEDSFPYTMRVESLITESHGSSSMASVCGGCLALMDAGVPVKTMVAGVAMGLLLDEESGSGDEGAVILTDILGTEDALGTMDFKVAGNDEGITTFQLDIKCEGLSESLLERALAQAKEGRLHILGEMKKACAEPRTQLADAVPKFEVFSINPDSLGKVIGRRGAMVEQIQAEFGLQSIDLEDDGTISIFSKSLEDNKKAREFILNLIKDDKGPPGKGKKKSMDELVIGTIYRQCAVKSVQSFGAFVEILPGVDGLVHISELDIERVVSVEQFCKEGDKFDVKLIDRMKNGKLRLSRKQVVEQEMAEAVDKAFQVTPESFEAEAKVIGDAINSIQATGPV